MDMFLSCCAAQAMAEMGQKGMMAIMPPMVPAAAGVPQIADPLRLATAMPVTGCGGSTETTTLATSGFPNRVAMPLDRAVSPRRLSGRFSSPSIFRLLQQYRP
jgi:hypothetical protein